VPDIQVGFLVDVNISVPAPQCAMILTSALSERPGLWSSSVRAQDRRSWSVRSFA
jgi:hypothetical protein